MENISKKKNKNAKKNRKPQKPPQKNLQKYAQKNSRNYHLQNMKQNMHLTEFTTTGLKQVNTEFKLYTTKHNLKRIYNKTIQKELIPPTKQTKYLKIIKLMPKNFKKIINFESPSFFKI